MGSPLVQGSKQRLQAVIHAAQGGLPIRVSNVIEAELEVCNRRVQLLHRNSLRDDVFVERLGRLHIACVEGSTEQRGS